MICAQNLEIQSKRTGKAGVSCPQFSVNFLFYETKLSISENRFYCNAGPFFSDHGNFLLPIEDDSFLIFRRIECSSIQKFETLLQNIVYFVSFQRNNRVIAQNGHGFKKYQLWKKFIFWQLVAKITNFTDIRQNNMLKQKKKKNIEN